MSWEESRCATPLKRDFLRAWFQLERRFFLTGGSALGLFYLDHRGSYDLDLFTVEEVGPKEVQQLVSRVAAQIEAQVQPLRSSADFNRFRLTRAAEREIIDVVVDRAPQIDPVKEEIDGVLVDTLREIVANKLTTLLSRSEPKDVVDLYFLQELGCDLVAAVPDAVAKDGGWEPAVVAMMLDTLPAGELPAWMIRELSPETLARFVHDLRLRIASLSLPPGGHE